MDESNTSLLERIAKDDNRAFRAFYDLYYSTIYKYASYYVKSLVLREEVVSDVFFQFWQNRKKNVELNNPEAYLITMTKNRALRALDNESRFNLEVIEQLHQDRLAHKQTPESILIDHEIAKNIKDAIDQLPERCRTIFLLAREEGLKYREIAEALQISEKTVDAQMVIAIRKLTQLLGKYFFFLFF
ncbi:MAG: RNA polymerase sigma-70 factor [Dysgonamonadaceae bacterium]|jgi:RNA polymerase sigma-70 factor (ECF subfamily)|nr:RNA polymerase sigma-70 factor [Dysgonamonadaceae bacterium]